MEAQTSLVPRSVGLEKWCLYYWYNRNGYLSRVCVYIFAFSCRSKQQRVPITAFINEAFQECLHLRFEKQSNSRYTKVPKNILKYVKYALKT